MKRLFDKCELCLAETGSEEYGVGLSHTDIDHDYSDFEHKRLCRNCYLRIRQFVFEQVHDNFGPRLEQIHKNLQAARLKMAQA